jgi:endonuclease/exonuclease/phosphatase family metal-dependent hydrolase
VTYTFVLQNVERPDSAAQNAATVRKVANNCDLAALNEAHDPQVKAAVKRLNPKVWRWYLPGENAFFWKKGKFTGLGHSQKLIMTGGLDRKKRRLGPNRYYAVQNLREAASRRPVRHVTTHLTAKAFTTAKFRQPMHRSSVTKLRHGVQALKRAKPDWPIIVTGDMNTVNTLNLGPGFKRVKCPPTYGKRHYDHVYVYGKVSITQVRALSTYSDHKGLKMRVQLL